MYRIYLLVIHLLLPFAVLRLILAGISNPQYRNKWRQRFGVVPGLNSTNQVIWIHAVSVGEVQAAKPLVEFLQNQFNNYEILITTVTPTGAEVVKNNFAGNVLHRYLPFDIPACVNSFLGTIKPSVLLVMETEIWPTLYYSCYQNNIPVALINARLSEKSLKRYRLVSNLCHETLGYLTVLAVQSQLDADRFVSVGADMDKLFITGNLKFDVSMPCNVIKEAEDIKLSFGNRPVLIAASTHEGEEEIIVDAMAQVFQKIPDCLLIIAPRHPDRALQLKTYFQKRSFKTNCYTDNDKNMKNIQIYILDILGKLPVYYATADIAFVGGSLVPVGGHNILEPAGLGLPILSGKYLFNFHEISELFVNANALLEINSSDELSNTVINLFEHPEFRHEMGARARAVVEENRGSINKLIKVLERALPQVF